MPEANVCVGAGASDQRTTEMGTGLPPVRSDYRLAQALCSI